MARRLPAARKKKGGPDGPALRLPSPGRSAAQIDDRGLKLFRKLQRGKFQFFDVEEHGETSAAITPTSPREHAKEA